MKSAQLSDLQVGRIGLGTMGMSSAYTGAGSDDAESIRDHPPRARPGRHADRHRRDLRPVSSTRSWSAGRIKGRRDEVVLATKFGMISHTGAEPGRLDSSPARHPYRRRGLAAAARHRPHRPLLPAPRRPEHADRGHRRRAGRPGGRGQGPPHRPVRGRRRHDPPRARGPPDHRAAVGVLAVDPRRRGGRCCRCCGSSASGSWRTPRSGAASSPAPSARPTTSPTTTSAGLTRASPGRTSERNLRLADEVEAIAAEVGATPAQVALAWLLAQGDDVVPDPRHQAGLPAGGERRRRRASN